MGCIMGDEKQANEQSHLYLVRVWSDPVGEKQEEARWHGKVQHIITGKSGYFSDWPALINLLTGQPPRPVNPGHDEDAK